jgi:phospholipase A-2-activating protein
MGAGAKDGQTRIVREGDSGVAYSWNAKEYKWDKIGEVVDGPGDNLDKKSLNGVTYDYVFDVDIGDGLPTRKLPYNHGQNPYDVADQWLANEELPAGYREQVVQFILQNTGSTAAPPQFDPAFVDPYTGGKSLSIISASISYTICNPMVAVALLEELDTLMSITAK